MKALVSDVCLFGFETSKDNCNHNEQTRTHQFENAQRKDNTFKRFEIYLNIVAQQELYTYQGYRIYVYGNVLQDVLICDPLTCIENHVRFGNVTIHYM